MNRFVKNIIIFSLLILFGMGGMEWYVEKRAYKYDLYASAARQFESNKDSINTLFLGTSLFEYGVDQNLLPDQSLKIAVTGQNVTHQYYISMEVIPNLPSLKRLVLELSYFTLRDDRDFRTENQRLIGWTGPTIYFHTKKYSPLSKWGWELWDARNFRTKLFSPETPPPYSESPADTLTDLQKSQLFREEAEVNLPSHTRDRRYYDYNLNMYERIISLAIKKGAELCIVIPPTTKEYRALCDSTQLAEMYSTACYLQQKFGGKIIDCFSDSSYTYRDFFDYNHLDAEHGAKKFTTTLLQDLATDSISYIIHR